ncbi:MFS transporter [Acerihabitans sp. TG2]|uniref:MFS transporter n=1 Tax=Acerihabitans sp. TG2 TaxID=3096008 RepID=UPI002B225170|nr:MFS transporter [Acerihabitans sp. TG2]MEA9390420.1 MFS transporter [Acerihabitans sp. TG2]
MKVKKLRWWVICLVSLGTILNALARSSLSVAAPTIFTNLHINEQQYSWILSAFQFTYTIAQPICGFIIDVIGLKLGFFIMIIAWSLTNMAHASCSSWGGLAFFRGLMGLSEAAAIPAGVKCNSEWFPAKERGIAGGIANIGTSIGAMLAPPLVVWAIMAYNWEMAFVITGALGLVFAVIWWFCYDTPQKHKAITPEELHLIEAGQEKHLAADHAKPSIGKLLCQRNFWGIALPRFLADPAWGTINFWLPVYLMTVRHMPLRDIAMFAWLPFLAADFGGMAGGFLNNFMMKRWRITTVNARRIGFSLGAILMLPLAFVGFVKSPYLAIGLVSICGFAHQMLSTQVITMATDLFKRNETSTVSGFAGTAGWSGIFICTLIMGSLVNTIGYNPFFMFLSIMDIIGAIILWTMVKEHKTPGVSRTELATVK